ncbi:MAG: hypothetical protein ABR568_23720 [Pyrinomonadaceae bacterium]
MKKGSRQKRILSLIRAKPIGTQEELRSLLERAGVPATQSSVSRDLEELGVVKHRGHYTVPRANGAAASAVAVNIDGAAIAEIVGTVAGEDTIFIAVNDRKAQRGAIRKVWELFG